MTDTSTTKKIVLPTDIAKLSDERNFNIWNSRITNNLKFNGLWDKSNNKPTEDDNALYLISISISDGVSNLFDM